ncbi:MAG: 30S ribosomal protein S3 [Anaerolineae bacterium]|nr:30S ribosomal protein S3 [Anaerolineae bacterium]
MGRKVHPYGFRLGIINDWRARWYADGRTYGEQLIEDINIRKIIHEELSRDGAHPGVSNLEIERFPNNVSVTIHTAKPGIIIGRKGAKINDLKKRLEGLTKKKVRIEVEEIQRPELVAALVAESIVQQVEKRVSHKRAMKQAVQRAIRLGAKGVRIAMSGRLAGSEMARHESVQEGRIPRHTLRSEIDYAIDEALTTYGRIGVKVWIYKGDKLPTLAEKAQA